MERHELIRAATSNFDDDEALRVLADRLQLAGSPAGELMAAQLAPTKVSAKRIAELAKASRGLWLGPLAGVISAVRFRRGLPSHIVLDRKAPTIPTDPLWAIVEAVDLDRGTTPQLAQLLPRLAHAHTIEGAIPQTVALLRGAARPPRLATLACGLGSIRSKTGMYITGDPDPEALAVVANDPGLTTLRHGDYFQAPAYAWLWKAPLAQRLEVLGVANQTRDRVVWGRLALPEWCEALANAPATLRELVLVEQDCLDLAPSGWTVRFARSAGATRFDTLRATYTSGVERIQSPVARLASGLQELGRGVVRAIAIDGVSAAMRAGDEWPQLIAQLDRQEIAQAGMPVA